MPLKVNLGLSHKNCEGNASRGARVNSESPLVTPPVAVPPAKTISAADLLAGATKKGKTSSHLVYSGEAGREAIVRWLQLDAQFSETKRELELLRDQILNVIRPWYEETCARRKEHEASVVVRTSKGTLRLSFQDRYVKLSIDREIELRSLLGADFERYFKRIVNLKVQKTVAEDPAQLDAMVIALAEKLGAENFASLFEVEQSLAPTTAFTETNCQFPQETRAALQAAGVKQIVAFAAK
jgi:hypothetical protein